MEAGQREQGQAEEVGGEAMDGRDAEERLKGDEQAEEPGDAFRGEPGAGKGFLPGQMSDEGNEGGEKKSGQQRGGGEKACCGGGGSQQEIAGAAGAHQQGTHPRMALQSDVVQYQAGHQGKGDGEGIEKGAEKPGHPQANQHGHGGGFPGNPAGRQRAVRAVTEVFRIIEKIVENQTGGVEEPTGEHGQGELGPMGGRGRGGEKEARQNVAGDRQQIGQAKQTGPHAGVGEARDEVFHEIIRLDGFVPEGGEKPGEAPGALIAGRWRGQCRGG